MATRIGMDLKSYLQEHGLSYRQFASQIGAASARTVHRYALNMRIPNRTMMAAIERETGGRVGPPDFYGAPPTEQQPVSEEV